MIDAVVIFNPEIELSELSVPNSEEKKEYNSTNPNMALGLYSPIIQINDKYFDHYSITSSVIEVGDFLPKLTISIKDDERILSNQAAVTDSIVKLFVRSKNKDFKPIRQDYKITSFSKFDSIVYITAVLNLPDLFNEKIISYGKLSSFDTLKKIAKDLKLGFASNETSTNDSMCHVCPSLSLSDFIQNDIIPSIYKDDSSFFKVFIDQFYYLNIIEINKMVVTDGELQKITSIKEIALGDVMNGEEDDGTLEEFFLHNIDDFGRTNFIADYNNKNSLGSAINSIGSKLYLQMYEKTDEEFKEFYIKPLLTEGSKEKYKTNEIINEIIKTVHFGEQNNINVHKNYFAAKGLNEINITSLLNYKLSVSLTTINPAIRCFMQIPIIIQNRDVDQFLHNDPNDENNDLQYNEKLKKEIVVDKFVSGFYISTKIRYIFTGMNIITMDIDCNKRDFAE